MGVSLTDALASPLLAAGAQGAFSVGASRAQRRWSEKMYKKYNSPQALVRQYQEAGINPALMFGQSTPAAPTESSPAALPDNPVGDVVGLLGQLMELDMLDIQKEDKELDVASKKLEYGLRSKYGDQFTSTQIREMESNIDYRKSVEKLNKYDLKYLRPVELALKNAEKEGITYDNLRKNIYQQYFNLYGYYPDDGVFNRIMGMVNKLIGEVPGVESVDGQRLTLPDKH